MVSITPLPRFTPGKGPPVLIEQEAGWAPEPVWTQKLQEKFSASVGDRTPLVQSVIRHFPDGTVLTTLLYGEENKIIKLL
jgi:hypothetical protein